MTNPADRTQPRTSALAPALLTSYLSRHGGRIGDSDTTFASYGDEDTAGDVIALMTELDGG